MCGLNQKTTRGSQVRLGIACFASYRVFISLSCAVWYRKYCKRGGAELDRVVKSLGGSLTTLSFEGRGFVKGPAEPEVSHLHLHLLLSFVNAVCDFR